MTTAVLVLVASAGGAGVCLFIAGVRRAPMDRKTIAVRHRVPTRRQLRRGAVALSAGLLAFMVTRWPVAIPLGALAVLGLRGLARAPEGHVIESIEAIASWTEMLRDTLAGAAGLTQALIATAQICPRPVRGQVGALASRLSSGAVLTAALRSFADELADPAADVVVATLLMAATERAHRLGDLLGALAESTREEVAMRQAVEASRASARSAVRTVTGFSFGFLGLMVLFARSYLEPYRAPAGQAVLVVVATLFGLGLWLMAAMVRARPEPRLLLTEPTK
ncbi:MAG: type II secretion system F family protein [Acidimicrobiales bacterium]